LRKDPHTLLVLAGPCTDEPYGKLVNQKIRELGLQSSVLLTGGLPAGDSRLLGLLQEARAVILPSISETFGLVILEAWAAGTLVLASRTSGATALLRDGQDGLLFDLDQPPTFHHALNQALTDAQYSEQLAIRGAEKVNRE